MSWKTGEGIPLSEYRWPLLLIALVSSLPLFLFLKFVQWFSRSSAKFPDDLPSNSLIFGFHWDFYLLHLGRTMEPKRRSRVVWLGYHGFLSYLPILVTHFHGTRIFRYRYPSAKKPFRQIVDFLMSHPETPFGILTDAGGPYGRVRESIVDLALASNRPVVALRTRYSRLIALGVHRLPLPLGSLEAKFSEIISVEKLKSMSRDAARDYLQKRIEEIS